MTQCLVESIPNVSEGRDHKVISSLIARVEAVSHVGLLDVHVDPDHHRSVFTLVGEPQGMERALFYLVKDAQRLIDLRQHQGEHPRIGAVDVIPWVPFQGVSMEECVKSAHILGDRIGRELEIPVFFYSQARRVPARERLEVIRRGGLSALGTRMANDSAWQPDCGPVTLHPTAGATAVGARFFLIAFNVILESSDLAVANAIAKSIRDSNGGLPAVKAIGVRLSSRNLVQVSMNLTDYRKTSLRRAYDCVDREARKVQTTILESEIVGLVPQGAWDIQLRHDLKLRSTPSDPVIENRLRQSFFR